MDKHKLNRRNARLGIAVLAVSGSMLGLAFAMAPLYSIICQKLGWEGTPQRAEAASTNITEIPVNVRFDANTDKRLPWSFHPVEKSVQLNLGETRTIFYRAVNNSDRAITGTATFNVTPEKAGIYFNKVACFCFEQQVLEPGQSVDMGVTFFVDPEMAKDSNTDDVHTITLSYTFYRSLNDGSAEGTSAQADPGKLTLEPVSGPASVN
jgi:cytochrome c oxidase assembly protein subunit 11